MTHITAALMSFRLVALMPHHLPRLIGFTAANRVDTEAFYQQAAWAPGGQVAASSKNAIGKGAQSFGESMKQLPRGPAGYISGPREASEEGGMDSTLRATTDGSSTGEEDV
jgi:hypothetical protein